MTCGGCESTIKRLLSGVAGVTSVNTDLSKDEVTVEMQKHISTETLQQALKNHPDYHLAEKDQSFPEPAETLPQTVGWFTMYKPILLIFAYITSVTFLVELQRGFSWMHWMSNFMGGFFLAFSFFKLLDLKGFAENYFSYDIIARRWFGYGYFYAFIELALGLAYISSFNPVLTNSITFVVMTISIIGVLQAVFSKRKVKCACLGSVFNLPMSTVTIIEDMVMIAMSLTSLLTLLVSK